MQFDGVTDREGAAALRGVVLLAPAHARPPLADPDDFYDTDLVGLQASTVDGEALGPVTDVVAWAGGGLPRRARRWARATDSVRGGHRS